MKKRSGFTLVELSIVLVIIGLLIGGILKGKAMIENARIKRLNNDITTITAAMYTYQDKYGELPGDDPQGASFQGNGNGYIEAGEQAGVWRNLIDDGLVSGDATQTTESLVAKKTPFGGYYSIRGSTSLPFYINTNGNNIANKIIKGIDIKEDDGVYNTGDVRSNRAYSTANNDIKSSLTWYVY